MFQQVPVYPVPYQSPVPPSTSPKPKSPVAPADDIQLPPIGFNRKTQPNGYWTPPPKYDDIFARRSRPPSSPQKVPKNSLTHLLCLLWSLKKHYSRIFLVFRLIVIFRLDLMYEIIKEIYVLQMIFLALVMSLLDKGEFTQQGGRKKRTAKRLCVTTNVTGLLLTCYVLNLFWSWQKHLFKGK